MFKDVLSITGKPGLFKLVSNAKNYLIVESLIDGKRVPSYQNEKVSLLKDIILYTNDGEKHLNELFNDIFELEKGNRISIDVKNNTQLQEYFVKVFPNYNRERIYNNDMKKILSWYNILVTSNITDFKVDTENKEDIKTEVKETDKDIKKVDKSRIVKKSVKKTSTKSVAAKQSTRVAVKKGS